MVADSYGQWQGFANQQDQIAASNYFASINAIQRAQQMEEDRKARAYNAWVQQQQQAAALAVQQAQEDERRREWAAQFGWQQKSGQQNLDLTKKYYDWQMTKPDDRLTSLKDRAESVALNMVQSGYPTDVAAKAVGLDESSFGKLAVVQNFLADQSQDEANQAESLARTLNEQRKIVTEYQTLSPKQNKTQAEKDRFTELSLLYRDANDFIQKYGENPKFGRLVGRDDNNNYFSRVKALPRFEWPAVRRTNEPAITEPTLPADTDEPDLVPATIPVVQNLGVYRGAPDTWTSGAPMRAGAFAGFGNQPTNREMAASYATTLLREYPQMSKAEAISAAKLRYPY